MTNTSNINTTQLAQVLKAASKDSVSNHGDAITDHLDIWTAAIKKKSASGRGSSKKSELYGIKKLRELILELAVRGKLVPQNCSDSSPQKALLESIEKKEALIKDGIIKKSRSKKQLKMNIFMFIQIVGLQRKLKS